MLSQAPSALPAELEDLVRRIIGCAIEVHRHLGPGYVEAVYFRALCVELKREGIPFEEQKVIQVMYRGIPIHTHRIDLLVDGQVVVELKAVAGLEAIHISQVVSYLRATDLKIGPLLNFNVRALRLGIKRVVR